MDAYTLYERVMGPLKRQHNKHEYSGDPEAWAEAWIDGLTNTQLLEQISFALEEMQKAGELGAPAKGEE